MNIRDYLNYTKEAENELKRSNTPYTTIDVKTYAIMKVIEKYERVIIQEIGRQAAITNTDIKDRFANLNNLISDILKEN